MKSFPLFIRLEGQRVAILGGGEAAAQKARLLRRTEARLLLMAPELDPELAALVAEGGAEHRAAVLDPAALGGVRLVLIATGCVGADACAAAVARDLGAIVNVVDRPELCDATFAALVDRDPVVVAIGTEGAAPVLGREIKTRLEELLEPRLGAFTALAGALRPRVAQHVPRARRRAFWEWAFAAPRRRFTRGDEAGAAAELEAAILAGGPPSDRTGRIALVAPGTAEPDLLTLRAVQRLQTADLILHPADLPPPLLELARRDAEREPLDPGATPEDIARRLSDAAAEGASAVLVAETAAAVAAALAALGVAAETVPGLAR